MEELQNCRRHHQEPVQRYIRMLEMISSMRCPPTEDLDRANGIHNLGDNLNTRVRLRGNRNETESHEVNGERDSQLSPSLVGLEAIQSGRGQRESLATVPTMGLHPNTLRRNAMHKMIWRVSETSNTGRPLSHGVAEVSRGVICDFSDKVGPRPRFLLLFLIR